MNELKHVAIIMDGNGRWATSRNLPRSAGHKAGSETLNKLALHILESGVEVLSVFAFSTENFKRSEEEVNFLMDLFVTMFKKDKNFFNKHNIKVIFSGRKKPLRKDVLKSMEELSKITENNTKGIFNICLNYGGQAEIVDATKSIVDLVLNNELDISELNEENYRKHLYNDLPPIDLLIRTSGEERISNFMLYNLAYSEMHFSKVLFPDFNSEEYDKVIDLYSLRNRRFGGYDKK